MPNRWQLSITAGQQRGPRSGTPHARARGGRLPAADHGAPVDPPRHPPLGIDSVQTEPALRQAAWDRLIRDFDSANLASTRPAAGAATRSLLVPLTLAVIGAFYDADRSALLG